MSQSLLTTGWINPLCNSGCDQLYEWQIVGFSLTHFSAALSRTHPAQYQPLALVASMLLVFVPFVPSVVLLPSSHN